MVPEHTNPPGGLANYYRNNVVGGPGAFVLQAKDFNSFGEAIIKKLIAEIADAGPARAEPQGAGHERVTEATHGWRRRDRWYSPPATDAKTTGNSSFDGHRRLQTPGNCPAGRDRGRHGGARRGELSDISADAVRRQVLSEIHSVTGLNPSLRGAATVSLFPTGSVSFADVVLGDAQRPALTAAAIDRAAALFPAADRPGRDFRRRAGAPHHFDRRGAEWQVQLGWPDRSVDAQPDQGSPKGRGLRDAN